MALTRNMSYVQVPGSIPADVCVYMCIFQKRVLADLQ